MAFNPAHGPIPKPEPRRKAFQRLSKAGKIAGEWEEFKQAVFYPSEFFGGDNIDRDYSTPLRVACSNGQCNAVGSLELMPKPNDRGRFWHVVDMQVDHIEPRAHEPGMRYELSNCRWLCGTCNEIKDGKH